MDIHARRWPRHYRALIEVIQGKWHTAKHLSTDRQSMMEQPLDVIRLYEDRCPRPEGGIIDKILCYDIEHVRRLLEAGADAGMVSGEGISALHALAYLRDTDAIDLASILVEKGASLNAVWPDSIDAYTFSGHKLSGSPLFCSILCYQVRFARELITLHVQHKARIKNYTATLKLAVNFWFYELAEALLDLFETDPFLCDATLPGGSTCPSDPELLRAAMTRRELISLERRACHGKLYDEAYAETLKLLIARGVDPTEGYYTSCPLYMCLINDDPISLRYFIEYLYEHYGGDPLTKLTDPGHMRGSSLSNKQQLTGLQTCIYAKSTECFHILLNEFPTLMENRSTDGMTALHLAAEYAANIAFLKALLDRGADVVAAASDSTPPLFRALLTRNTEGADSILKYCSPEQQDVLFSRQLDTGRSLFSRLVDNWLIDRDAKLLNSFKWLADHCGAHFYGSICTLNGIIVQIPTWNELFATVRPSSRSWQLQDLALATFFLDTFPEQINNRQQDGHTPLHVAVWYGHVEIVRLILLKGADVNLEFGIGVWAPERHQFTGRTALDLSVFREGSTHLPDIIRRGGYEEVASWKADCEIITRTLQEAGGRSGSRGTMVENFETLNLDGTSNITVSSTLELEPLEQESVGGAWPGCFDTPPASHIETLFTNMRGPTHQPFARSSPPLMHQGERETGTETDCEYRPKRLGRCGDCRLVGKCEE